MQQDMDRRSSGLELLVLPALRREGSHGSAAAFSPREARAERRREEHGFARPRRRRGWNYPVLCYVLDIANQYFTSLVFRTASICSTFLRATFDSDDF